MRRIPKNTNFFPRVLRRKIPRNINFSPLAPKGLKALRGIPRIMKVSHRILKEAEVEGNSKNLPTLPLKIKEGLRGILRKTNLTTLPPKIPKLFLDIFLLGIINYI